MSRRPQNPSLRLPQSLLDQIGETSGKGKRGGTHYPLSRKDVRKQQRQERQTRKAEHFSHLVARPQSQVQGKRSLSHHQHDADAPARKRPRLEAPVQPKQAQYRPGSNLPKPAKPTAMKAGALPAPAKPKTALQKLAVRTDTLSNPGVTSRTQREKEEDAYIAYLESKLGWRKGGKKTSTYGSGLGDDGLDELLGGLEASAELGGVEGERESESESDVDNDGEETGEEEMGEEFNEDEEEDNAPELFEPGSDSAEGEDADSEVDNGEKDWNGIEHAASDTGQSQNTAPAITSTNTMSRYIAPALRNRIIDGSQESAEFTKLKRQVKGQLNRLSEQNTASILDGIEELYRKHRRHDVSSTLTTLIIDGISSHAILLDSYVVLHAAFVAALYKIIGLEFGAFFVQSIVTSYEHHYASLTRASLAEDAAKESEAPGGKEAANLVVLLTELYNFQVVSCVLVYDVIRALLEGPLREFDVELLLKITRNSGQQLRQDDPSALKNIVQLVQSKVAAQRDSLSSRTRFMLETLTNLKNNKPKKGTPGNAGQTGGIEAVERMKKFLAGLGKRRHVLVHEPLRVSLADLRAASTKGKWWLVGAAWGGDPLVDRQADAREQAQATPAVDATSSQLLKLARKQGMNTDVRRSIFVVLMSSDDYVDACERLAQLNLTEIQQREVVRVILHCCGNEKAYNPYYTLVIQHLCTMAHSYKITLQFCLWDFLREMGEISVGGAEVVKNLKDRGEGEFEGGKQVTERKMHNLARAYAWWVAKGQLSLAILKPVDFTALKPRATTFLHDFFTHLFVSTQLSNPALAAVQNTSTTKNRQAIEVIFVKAARVSALAMGLVHFLGQTAREAKYRDRERDAEGVNWVRWARGVARDTLRSDIDVMSAL